MINNILFYFLALLQKGDKKKLLKSTKTESTNLNVHLCLLLPFIKDKKWVTPPSVSCIVSLITLQLAAEKNSKVDHSWLVCAPNTHFLLLLSFTRIYHLLSSDKKKNEDARSRWRAINTKRDLQEAEMAHASIRTHVEENPHWENLTADYCRCSVDERQSYVISINNI